MERKRASIWLRRLLVPALILAALPPAPAPASSSAFVTRSGSKLMLDGRPWRALGVNAWDLDPSRVLGQNLTGCYYQHPDIHEYLDTTFRQIASETGATVVRTFGFRAMYTAGGRDWSATDKLLYYAQKHQIRLIPVFGDQYATCGAQAKTPSWYRSGYKRIERPWNISFRDYVVKATRRYRSSPTIALWQLMNEASSPDVDALAGFSRDMVRAIREDAGDRNHLINLGTANGVRPAFDRLLSCGPGGGCNSLAEAHVYDPTDAVPGAPLPSKVGASLRFWNAQGNKNELGHVTPALEFWSAVRANVSSPGNGRSYTDWGLRLTAPSSGPWVAYVDDVRVMTQTGPLLYSFEAGTDGFSSSQASVTSSVKQAKAGTRALRVSVPAGTETVTIRGPKLQSAPSSVELQIRPSLRAPGKREGSGPAAMLHAAVVGARKPFIMGELGYHAAVPGLTKCANYRTLQARAQAIDAFIGGQLDAERGGSGVILWDWKDPALQSTLPDGRKQNDPTVDCWSLTPGDPANAVLKRWADAVQDVRLPEPVRRWGNPITQVVLVRPSGVIARGVEQPVAVRLTKAGIPMRGVTIRSTGCAGEGKTDALGHASFRCKTSALGELTVRVRPDRGDCDCDVSSTFTVVSKRAVSAAAIGSFVERGKRLPITISIGEANGSVRGIRWKIPECGLSGTIGSSGSLVTFTRTCSTSSKAWAAGGRVLTFIVPETGTTAPVRQQLAGFAMERVYRDPASKECVGLSPTLGWVAASTAPGACTGSATSLAKAFVFQVPAAARARAFVRNGNDLLVAAEMRAGFRIDGRFDYTQGRTFGAIVTRSGRPTPLRSG